MHILLCSWIHHIPFVAVCEYCGSGVQVWYGCMGYVRVMVGFFSQYVDTYLIEVNIQTINILISVTCGKIHQLD